MDNYDYLYNNIIYFENDVKNNLKKNTLEIVDKYMKKINVLRRKLSKSDNYDYDELRKIYNLEFTNFEHDILNYKNFYNFVKKMNMPLDSNMDGNDVIVDKSILFKRKDGKYEYLNKLSVEEKFLLEFYDYKDLCFELIIINKILSAIFNYYNYITGRYKKKHLVLDDFLKAFNIDKFKVKHLVKDIYQKLSDEIIVENKLNSKVLKNNEKDIINYIYDKINKIMHDKYLKYSFDKMVIALQFRDYMKNVLAFNFKNDAFMNVYRKNKKRRREIHEVLNKYFLFIDKIEYERSVKRIDLISRKSKIRKLTEHDKDMIKKIEENWDFGDGLKFENMIKNMGLKEDVKIVLDKLLREIRKEINHLFSALSIEKVKFNVVNGENFIRNLKAIMFNLKKMFSIIIVVKKLGLSDTKVAFMISSYYRDVFYDIMVFFETMKFELLDLINTWLIEENVLKLFKDRNQYYVLFELLFNFKAIYLEILEEVNVLNINSIVSKNG
jgi:hypothetical protein